MVTKKSPTKPQARKAQAYEDEAIAIVGMASQFPDADNLYDFWTNICQKRDSVTSVDEKDSMTYWDKEYYFDPDPSKKDKTYMYKAGFIKPIEFDPVEFKIPPVLIESISTSQLFALHVAKRAIEDANLLRQESKLDRSKVGVILGGAGNGNTAFSLLARNQSPMVRSAMLNSGVPEDIADDVLAKLNDSYLDWNEDSFPGFLGNVACGRIASYFDFGGTSNMVDAACGSSHAAIKSAVNELRSGSCDAVLTGGVNLENSIFSFLCFSKTPALSKAGICRPFDDQADGMLLGDGVGLVVLKRLSDAVADGDRIYSVIKSVEASSDGKAKSVFAPRDKGQVNALQRSYARTQLSPQDIELVEAHGTGTASGDDTELRSLGMVFGNYELAPQSIAVGSIKSQIGHARCAAGAASLIKVSQALHHKVIPPTINVTTPNSFFADENNPFYISAEARPWVKKQQHKPRCAATSGFGFGGTNYHIILEEYQHEHQGPYRQSQLPEVVVFSATSAAQLQQDITQAAQQWRSEQGSAAFRQHLETQTLSIAGDAARLTLVCRDAHHAASLVEKVLPLLAKQPDSEFSHPLGVYYSPRSKVANKDQVAVLFPGQGSQYLNMARDMAIEYPEFRTALQVADAEVAAKVGENLSNVVYPIPVFSEEQVAQQHAKLRQTEFTQPALGAISAAYYRLLSNMGLKAGKFAGHSYGELTALWAAGTLTEQQLYQASVARAMAMKQALEQQDENGVMYAVEADGETVSQVINAFPELVVANFNSPQQTVFAGAKQQAEQAAKRLTEQQLKCQQLNVDAAFHSPYIATAQQGFGKALKGMAFKQPQAPIYANSSAKPYSGKAAAMKETLASQLTSSVRFVELIEQMYADGVRVFIEVGPKGVLSNLVKAILGDKPYDIVATNPSSSSSSVEQFYKATAQLLALGVELDCIDPYRLRKPLEAKRSAMTITLDGGNYATPKRRELMTSLKQAKPDAITAKLSEQVAQQVAQKEAQWAEKMAAKDQEIKQLQLNNQDLEQQLEAKMQQALWVANNANSSSNTQNSLTRELTMSQNQSNAPVAAVSGQLQAQQQLSEVHSQFQVNQQQYLTMLGSVIKQQQNALNEFKDHASFNQVLGHIDHTLAVLEKNQSLYHVNHEQYFQSQQALLGQVEPQVATSGATVGNLALQQSPAMAEPQPQTVTDTSVQAAPVAAPEMAPPQAPEAVAPSNVAAAPVAAPEAPVAAPETTATATTEVSGDTSAAQLDNDQRSYFESLTQEGICSLLVEIVSDKTGYPTDMIDPEMDLESDLGIDSIKRIEIFAALFERLWGRDSEDSGINEDDMDGDINFDTLNTISRIAEFAFNSIQEVLNALDGGEVPAAVAKQSAEPAVPQSAPQQEYVADADVKKKTQQIGFFVSTDTKEDSVKKSQLQSESAAPPSLVNRYIAQLTAIPLPDQQAVLPQQDSQWLVLANSKKEAAAFEAVLTQQQQHFSRVILAQKKAPGKDSYALNECDEAAIQTLLETIVNDTKRDIAGVLLVAPEAKAETLEKVYDDAEVFTLKAVFMLAKVLQPMLQQQAQNTPAYFFTVSRNDGQFGTSSKAKNTTLNSALSGLTKSLNYEWSQVFCRHLECATELTYKQVSEVFKQELSDPDRTLSHVARNSEQRFVLTPYRDDIAHDGNDNAINEQSVLLVSGGAKGITAGCVLALAERFKCRFALLGRTELEPLPQWAQGIEQEAELKQQAISHLKAQSEAMTPAKVDALLNHIKGLREINQTLTELQQLGVTAQYYAVDITDQTALSNVVDQAQQHLGTITGVIHGAGNLADKKIERKTLEDFATVFDTKILGLHNLLTALDKSKLETVLLFSSVSGFFGNAGQTDYAMSNEVLSRTADVIKRHYPSCLVRAINWGPWDGGMVNDVLKKAYASRNLVLIDKPSGYAACVAELTASNSAYTQVLIGGASYHADKKPVSMQYQQPQVITRQLLASATPALADHQVAGSVVLPAMFALNWIINHSLNLYPGFLLSEVHDFTVLKGVVFDGKQSDQYQCVISSDQHSHSKLLVHVEIVSQQHNKTCKHYKASLALAAKIEANDEVLESNKLKQEAALALPIYQNDDLGYLFHGASFQGIEQVIRHDAKGMLASCRLAEMPTAQGQFAASQFDGRLADVFVQLPYLWLRLHKQTVGLPLKLGQLLKYRDIACGERFYVEAEVQSCSKQTLLADIKVFNSRRELAYQLQGVKYTQLASLARSENARLKEVIEHEG